LLVNCISIVIPCTAGGQVIMFKLNDKKHRKRALMKLQCVDGHKADKDEVKGSGDKDDFYSVSNGVTKVTNKTVECAIQYNLDEAPNHLVRKTMKYEEVHSGFDTVDRAGSSQMMKNFSLDFPSIKRQISSQSKVAQLDQGLRACCCENSTTLINISSVRRRQPTLPNTFVDVPHASLCFLPKRATRTTLTHTHTHNHSASKNLQNCTRQPKNELNILIAAYELFLLLLLMSVVPFITISLCYRDRNLSFAMNTFQSQQICE